MRGFLGSCSHLSNQAPVPIRNAAFNFDTMQTAKKHQLKIDCQTASRHSEEISGDVALDMSKSDKLSDTIPSFVELA